MPQPRNNEPLPAEPLDDDDDDDDDAGGSAPLRVGEKNREPKDAKGRSKNRKGCSGACGSDSAPGIVGGSAAAAVEQKKKKKKQEAEEPQPISARTRGRSGQLGPVSSRTRRTC